MIHASAAATDRPTSPRAERREATSERFLDAAEAILGAEGMDALTMQRLAREVGCAVGAAYRYHASKEAIVAGLQRRVFEGLAADLEAALARFEARSPRAGMVTALARVALVARVYATLAHRRPLHARLLARMMGDPENVLDDAHGRASVALAVGIGAAGVRELRAAREAGALGPGDDVERALLLWASLQGVAQARKLERWKVPGLSTDALAEQLVRTLLVGWGAEPARAREAIARAAESATKEKSR